MKLITFWKNKTNVERVVFLTICMLNVLFLVYWFLLSRNYCLHFDDAHFMWRLRDYSMFEYISDMYVSRGGNFVGYGINAILFTISNYLSAYRFWHIIFYLIGISMVYNAVKSIRFNMHKFDLILTIITFYNIYILTSVDFAVFTWICAMGYYLFAPAICLLLKYINSYSLKPMHYIILVFLAMYIAGNSISISTVAFMVLLANGLYLWHKQGWNIKKAWNTPQIQRLVYITIFMLILFAIVVIAPGNYNRLASAEDIEQPKSIFEFLVACGKCIGMFGYMMSFYLLYHAIIFALGYSIGTQSNCELSISRAKMIILTIGIYAIYLFVSVMPLAYLSNGFQIQRNYTHLSFFYMACIFIIGYIFGIGKPTNLIKSQVATICCTIFMTIIVSLNLYKDIPVAKAYRIAHEQRETFLLNLQAAGNKDVIYVDPYPSTATQDAKYNILSLLGKTTNKQVIYYESDTDYTPNEYESHIRKLLNLDFHFVLKQDCEASLKNEY